MTVKDRLILVAKVADILARDACAAIPPFAVRRKIGLIKTAKGAGLFAGGVFCGIMLRGGTSPATSDVQPASAITVSANKSAGPAVASGAAADGQPSETTKKINTHGVRMAGAATESARKPPAARMTRLEFRQKLAVLQKHPPAFHANIKPTHGGDGLYGTDLIEAFGRPDSRWTLALPDGADYQQQHVKWQCSDGSVELVLAGYDSVNTEDIRIWPITIDDIIEYDRSEEGRSD